MLAAWKRFWNHCVGEIQAALWWLSLKKPFMFPLLNQAIRIIQFPGIQQILDTICSCNIGSIVILFPVTPSPFSQENVFYRLWTTYSVAYYINVCIGTESLDKAPEAIKYIRVLSGHSRCRFCFYSPSLFPIPSQCTSSPSVQTLYFFFLFHWSQIWRNGEVVKCDTLQKPSPNLRMLV